MALAQSDSAPRPYSSRLIRPRGCSGGMPPVVNERSWNRRGSIRAVLSSIRKRLGLCRVPVCSAPGKQRPRFRRAQEEPLEEGFYANGKTYNSLPTQNMEEHHFVPGLMWCTLPMSKACTHKRGHCAEYPPLAGEWALWEAVELSNSKTPPRSPRDGVSVLGSGGAFSLFPPSEPRQSAEQARNRDHDSRDPYSQTRKQQEIAQERSHIAPPL